MDTITRSTTTCANRNRALRTRLPSIGRRPVRLRFPIRMPICSEAIDSSQSHSESLQIGFLCWYVRFYRLQERSVSARSVNIAPERETWSSWPSHREVRCNDEGASEGATRLCIYTSQQLGIAAAVCVLWPAAERPAFCRAEPYAMPAYLKSPSQSRHRSRRLRTRKYPACAI